MERDIEKQHKAIEGLLAEGWHIATKQEDGSVDLCDSSTGHGVWATVSPMGQISMEDN